jgi:CheY-like chemotaxis protein
MSPQGGAPLPLPKILVVDDEPANLSTFQRALRGQYHLVLASSGDDALRLLADLDIDVLVTDFSMPGMDGRELLERARKLHPSLPCVFVTAYAELDSVRDAARRNGVVKVLMKPWDRESISHWLSHCVSIAHMRKAVLKLKSGSTGNS